MAEEKDDSDGGTKGVSSSKNEELPQGENTKNTNIKNRFSEVKKWFEKHKWKENPFTLKINPDLFVGYKDQTRKLLATLEERHKLSLVVGPTGSGKTTLLKWVMNQLPENEFDTLFISTPPSNINEFVHIFNTKYRPPWYLRLFFSNIKTVHQIPGFLNKKLGKQHLVLICDEIHESSKKVLEWLRVLSDQVDNISLVVAGLPAFNKKIKEELETFQKRIMTKIELISLTKKEMENLITKRIEYVGGNNTEPFTEDLINAIYQETGGFPREVIRTCNKAVNKAIEKNKETLDPDLLKEEKKEEATEKVSLDVLNNLTPRQNEIIDILATGDFTPGQIAEKLDLKKYKSRQHAVRSVNNILTRLVEEDLVERKRKGRTFVYTLSPRIKTLVVKT